MHFRYIVTSLSGTTEAVSEGMAFARRGAFCGYSEEDGAD